MKLPQLCRVLRGRAREHFFEALAAILQIGQLLVEHLATPVNDQHAATDRFDFRENVGGENDGLATDFSRRRQTSDEFANFTDLNRIEPHGRFVQNENRRLVHDRLSEADALPIALR